MVMWEETDVGDELDAVGSGTFSGTFLISLKFEPLPVWRPLIVSLWMWMEAGLLAITFAASGF